MHLTIKATRQIWSSPDGQRKIYEVITDSNNEYKTYSDHIGTAQPGTSFDVVMYDKPTKQGPETFIKQKPKDEEYGQSDNGYSHGPAPAPTATEQALTTNPRMAEEEATVAPSKPGNPHLHLAADLACRIATHNAKIKGEEVLMGDLEDWTDRLLVWLENIPDRPVNAGDLPF